MLLCYHMPGTVPGTLPVLSQLILKIYEIHIILSILQMWKLRHGELSHQSKITKAGLKPGILTVEAPYLCPLLLTFLQASLSLTTLLPMS